MKKTYIIPSLEVIQVKTQQMLAASQVGFGDSVTSATGAEAPEFEWDEEY